jgi:arylsulfatase A-like enzyme
MRSDVITLPGLLRERGYVTGAFSGNSSWVVPEYLGRGFLRFRAYQIEHLLRRTVHGRKIDKQIEARGYHSAGRGRTAQAIRDEFLQFVDDYPDRPFFAYLCFMDVNRAFHDSRLNRGEPEEAVLRAYEEAAVDLDREIGELLAELRRRGKSRNTIVAVTSDHGESFGPKIAKDHLPTGHGTSLYREQFQVPLIVSFPGHIASGLIVNDTVSIRQIPATVLDLLRIENSRIPGNSLLRAAGAQNCVLGSLRFVESAREDRSMVCGAWHYIATRANQETGTAKELFNLAEDPLESRNLAGAGSAAAVQTDIERQMQRLLTAGAATSALLAFAGKE